MNRHLEEGVTLIPGGNGGRFPYSHSLLLEGDGRILLDTGSHRQRLKKVAEKGVDLVIFTHFHRDHVYFFETFHGVPKAAHFLDAPPLESMDAFFEYTGFQLDGSFPKDGGWLFRNIKPVSVDRLLHNGETLDLGKVRLKLLHTPGHTPGHCSFMINDTLLFSADIELSSFGPWYGNVKSDLEDFLHSIKRLQKLQPSKVITSHHDDPLISENIFARFQEYYKVVEKRDGNILALLQEAPSLLEELVGQQVIYKKYRDNHNIYRFERNMIHHHLRRLEKLKLVKKDDRDHYHKL